MRIRIRYKNPGWGLKEYAALTALAFTTGAGGTYAYMRDAFAPQEQQPAAYEEMIPQEAAPQEAAPAQPAVLYVDGRGADGHKQYTLMLNSAPAKATPVTYSVPQQHAQPLAAPQRAQPTQQSYNERSHPVRGAEVDPSLIKGKSLDQVLQLADGKLERMPYHSIVHNGAQRWAGDKQYHLEYLVPEIEKLTYAKMTQESRFNPKAASPRSALGLMQVLYTEEISKARPILERQHKAQYNQRMKEYDKQFKEYSRRVKEHTALAKQIRQRKQGVQSLPPAPQRPHKPTLDPVTADDINEYLLKYKPQLVDPQRNIPDGIHYIVDALFYAEKKICRNTKPHIHTPAVAEQIRQTAMADYNAGRGYLEKGRKAEEWKNRKSRFKNVFQIASILKRLPRETREYVPSATRYYNTLTARLR